MNRFYNQLSCWSEIGWEVLRLIYSNYAEGIFFSAIYYQFMCCRYVLQNRIKKAKQWKQIIVTSKTDSLLKGQKSSVKSALFSPPLMSEIFWWAITYYDNALSTFSCQKWVCGTQGGLPAVCLRMFTVRTTFYPGCEILNGKWKVQGILTCSVYCELHQGQLNAMSQSMHISPWGILQFISLMSCQLRHASPCGILISSSDCSSVGKGKRMMKWSKLSMNVFPDIFLYWRLARKVF